MSARDAARPDPRFDWAAELVLAQNFDRLHATFNAGALIAHLRDKVRPRSKAITDHSELSELMHQRFLRVDMFVVLERRQYRGGVMKVGHVHDHGIEIVDFAA